MNLTALGVAVAVAALGLKYLVIDLLQSETEAMTLFRIPLASARANIEAVEYRRELAKLYLDISQRQALVAADPSGPEGSTEEAHIQGRGPEETLEALVVRLSGADYGDAIERIYSAARLLAGLDRQYLKVRSAGRFEWLWGAASIVAAIAWAAVVGLELSMLYATVLGVIALALVVRACYGRLRYEMDKRHLGRLVNEHS